MIVSEGPYLVLKTYQYTDWESSRPGVTAVYNNKSDKKTVNKLAFSYYVPAEFKSSKLTVRFSIKGENEIKEVATLVIDANTTKDSVLNFSKTFNSVVFESLIIQTITNDTALEGFSVVSIKEASVSYVE